MVISRFDSGEEALLPDSHHVKIMDFLMENMDEVDSSIGIFLKALSI